MFSGKVFQTDLLEFRCWSTGNYIGTSGQSSIICSHTAELVSSYRHAFGVAEGVILRGYTQTSPNDPVTFPDEGVFTFQFGPFTHTISETVHREDWEIRIEVENFRIYQHHNGFPDVYFDDVRFYDADNTLVFSGGSYNAVGTVRTIASTLPIWNGCFTISGASDVSFSTPTGWLLRDTDRGVAGGQHGGGFRFDRDGTMTSLPVIFQSPTTFANQGYSFNEKLDLVTNTWDVKLFSEYDLKDEKDAFGPSECSDYYAFSKKQRSSHVEMSADVVPNLPKGVTRYNSDYMCMVGRYGFPQVTKSAGLVIYGTTRFPINYSDTSEVLPAYSAGLGEITNATHSLEEPFSKPSYSRLRIESDVSVVTNNYWQIADFSTVAVPVGNIPDSDCIPSGYTPTTRQEVYNYSWGTVVWNSSCSANLKDLNRELFSYYNTWVNPHWSYYIYAPTEANPNLWPVFDSPEWEYWHDYNEVYGYYPSLASSRTRSKVITEPWGLNNATNHLPYFVPSQTWWWGISRPQVRQFPDTAYTLTSANTWTATNATLAHAANIGVVTSAVNAEVIVELNDYTTAPCMFPSIANKIQLGWTLASGTCKVYLENYLGDRLLLTDNVAGTLDLVQGEDSQYAGTWEQDFGLSDLGTDATPADGDSPTVMASNEQRLSFQMLGNHNYMKLVFVFSAVGAHTLQYPILKLDRPSPESFALNSTQQVSYDANSQAILYGLNTYWNGLTIVDSPIAVDPFRKRSALDALCFYANTFNKTTATSGISALISAHYDATEYSQNKHLVVDPFDQVQTTHSFMCKGTNLTLVLVNSYSEIPPLAAFPSRELINFAPQDKTVTQLATSYCQNNNYYLSDTDDFYLDGYPLSNDFAKEREGWYVHVHRPVVFNNEPLKTLKRNSDYDLATLRPWRGQFFLDGTPHLPPDQGNIKVAMHDRFMAVAFLNADSKPSLEIIYTDASRELITVEPTPATYVNICALLNGIGLLYFIDGRILLSWDFGSSWKEVGTITSMAGAIAAMDSPMSIIFALEETPSHGLTLTRFFTDGTSEVEPISGVTIEPGEFDLYSTNRYLMLGCIRAGETTRTVLISRDFGKTWKQI